MAKQKNSIPSVLSFERKLVPSDGFFYGTVWDRRQTDEAEPLVIVEKSVRGTISHRVEKKNSEDSLKKISDPENANLQIVDHCALAIDQDTLKVVFTLKVLGNLYHPSACNNIEFRKTYEKAVKEYIHRTGFTELAKRYATNIANGRFLWRNRVGAESVEIHVKVLKDKKYDQKSWIFDALSIPLSDFDYPHSAVSELAEGIASVLCSQDEFMLLEVTAYAKIGYAQEVYPSQELVLDKKDIKYKDKSKILYQVGGIAGFHSQKIGNALRTVDSWYPSEDRKEPIPAETYGTVSHLGKAYRSDKDSFFVLFDKFATGDELDNLNDQHYVMSVLVRGGVFGKTGKDDKKNEKDGTNDQDSGASE